MAVSVNHRSRTAAGSARGSPPVHARELALQCICMQRIAKGAVNARGGLSFQNRGPLRNVGKYQNGTSYTRVSARHL